MPFGSKFSFWFPFLFSKRLKIKTNTHFNNSKEEGKFACHLGNMSSQTTLSCNLLQLILILRILRTKSW